MWFKDFLLTAILARVVAGQKNIVPSGAEGTPDLRPDGGYGFRYATRDQGGHYGEAVATPDNTVSGKFGYREPGTGRNLETRYTAGGRGFRAQGPSIHRLMDLGQAQRPYNPPGSNPTYSTYYDPNEDSSYHFDFSTNEYKRTENGGPLGQVSGAFSYIDDAGDIHNVQFEAGSQTGFHVKSAYPDSNHNYNDLYFRGDGKVPLRGRTSVLRGLDGSYRFTTHSQDQRRSEVKDAAGNTRGSYTYIDKDGAQRTVQYIAGPNIGYKIVNEGAQPSLDSFFPYVQQNYIPSILKGNGGKPGYGGGESTSSPLFSVNVGETGGENPNKLGFKPSQSPTNFGFDMTTQSSITVGFGESANNNKGEGNNIGSDGSSLGGGREDGSSNKGGNSFGAGKEGNSFGNGDSSLGSDGTSFGGGSGSFNKGDNSFGADGSSLGGGATGSSESSVSNSENSYGLAADAGGTKPSSAGNCCPAGGTSSSSNTNSNGQNGGTGVVPSGVDSPPYPLPQKPSYGLTEPPFTTVDNKQPQPNTQLASVNDFLSPTSGFPSHAGFPEEDQNSPKPFQKPSFKPFTIEDNLFLQRPFSALPPASSSSSFYPDQNDNLGKDSSFSSSSEYYDGGLDKDGAFSQNEFRGFPPGVSVKAHVQSIDINPFGTKVPTPGEALDRLV